MLRNIKSNYITKILFRYVDEEQKLKIVKYNKSLQKNININIINYKFISGRYIIYGSNGNGKEYNGENDQLIFEGEYLNGERNGKGKGYDQKGNIIYELIDGKGKIKEYCENEDFSYEGEYLNGERNGNGKEYDIKVNLTLKVKYINGKRISKAVIFKH